MDEDELTRAVVPLATLYGRYGIPLRITALHQDLGLPWWSKDRVQLNLVSGTFDKVPIETMLPRRQLWLNRRYHK